LAGKVKEEKGKSDNRKNPKTPQSLIARMRKKQHQPDRYNVKEKKYFKNTEAGGDNR